MWWDSWSDVGRVAAVGAAAYVSLVLVLRLSGKRTLAKLNAFDLVVTVALCSTLASAVITTDVALAQAVTACSTTRSTASMVAMPSPKPSATSRMGAPPALARRWTSGRRSPATTANTTLT